MWLLKQLFMISYKWCDNHQYSCQLLDKHKYVFDNFVDDMRTQSTVSSWGWLMYWPGWGLSHGQGWGSSQTHVMFPDDLMDDSNCCMVIVYVCLINFRVLIWYWCYQQSIQMCLLSCCELSWKILLICDFSQDYDFIVSELNITCKNKNKRYKNPVLLI